MKYNEFVETVRVEVEKLCPFDMVDVKKIMKNNSTEFYGLVIKKEGVSVSPTIYLEKYYEEYMQGRDVESIVQEIVEIDIRSREDVELQIDTYRDFDKMKDVIMYKIINTEYNREILQNIPHREYLDLSIVYYCLVQDSLGCVASWTISNEIMKLWNVDEEVLFELATENCKRILPYNIMSITDVICDILMDRGDSKEEMLDELFELEQGPRMYVVTNKNKIYGASVIFYPGMLFEFAQQKGDFYILPSSIHEAILIPTSENVNKDELAMMVKEVNETQVPKEDFLSNEVYYYDTTKNELQKLSKEGVLLN